jgi:hypothetical protein
LEDVPIKVPQEKILTSDAQRDEHLAVMEEAIEHAKQGSGCEMEGGGLEV